MTITEHAIEPFDIRLTQAIATGRGAFGDRSGVRLRLLADGIEGVGETAPIPGIPSPTVDAIASDIETWAAEHARRPVDDALRSIDDHTMSPNARFAVHTALADLAASTAGVPLHAWLRAGSGSTVRTNALVTSENPATVHANVSTAVGNGASSVKLKVGALEPAADVTRVIAASEAAGPRVELRLDANAAWSPDQVRHVVGRVGPHRLGYIEDPTSEPDTYAALESELGVRIAYDVSPAHASSIDQLASRFGQSVFVVKAAAIGGVDRILDLARLLDGSRTLVVTSSIDGPVGLLAGLHAAAALPDDLLAHGLGTAELVRDMPHELVPSGGIVTLPAHAPGVGIAAFT